MNGEGKVVMESIIEIKASTILQCIQGVQGDLHVTLEEGTWAAWRYGLQHFDVHPISFVIFTMGRVSPLLSGTA